MNLTVRVSVRMPVQTGVGRMNGPLKTSGINTAAFPEFVASAQEFSLRLFESPFGIPHPISRSGPQAPSPPGTCMAEKDT